MIKTWWRKKTKWGKARIIVGGCLVAGALYILGSVAGPVFIALVTGKMLKAASIFKLVTFIKLAAVATFSSIASIYYYLADKKLGIPDEILNPVVTKSKIPANSTTQITNTLNQQAKPKNTPTTQQTNSGQKQIKEKLQQKLLPQPRKQRQRPMARHI